MSNISEIYTHYWEHYNRHSVEYSVNSNYHSFKGSQKNIPFKYCMWEIKFVVYFNDLTLFQKYGNLYVLLGCTWMQFLL